MSKTTSRTSKSKEDDAADKETPKRTLFAPLEGRTVEAGSLEEAVEILDKDNAKEEVGDGSR